MKKGQKTFFVENLAEELKSANSAVLINFAGMGVKTQQDLKKRLKEVDAKMVVVKNTLFKLAGEKAKLPNKALSDSALTGQTALIITEKDPISPLQVLAKFTKEFEVPHLKVGIVEGFFQNEEELTRLSKLPGKDALVAQVIGAIASPMYGLIGTLQGNLQKLVFVLNEAKNQKS
ncbi:50S ribosomal protein L10 [Patescibacteria group bacterium]|nr:50S ribosomal protein L10 [Patescibacteria group bacterium]MBU0777202.1 50S ribosomal protein L10 [Patescibacteria group bacterium]MBU0845897.1 50S ribosomal protein L10 [Patescibacteria group bacterium]MBU0922924.1 50S ribosomal protein L10 [Patescibacteria group bacterium]MBU1066343.1 50S ribosomal protein L10 [Patescibacteria group bacterium]